MTSVTTIVTVVDPDRPPSCPAMSVARITTSYRSCVSRSRSATAVRITPGNQQDSVSTGRSQSHRQGEAGRGCWRLPRPSPSSKQHQPDLPNLSAYDRCSNTAPIFTALPWTHSDMPVSLSCLAAQNKAQHSHHLTSAESKGQVTSLGCWRRSS